jgi:tetratricopeptide (TPR) repeat protein
MVTIAQEAHMPDDPPRKLNIFVGGPPPPGGIEISGDGTIRQLPHTVEARAEWTIFKMTHKIAREPDDGEWYYERAMALATLGRYPQAIEDFSMLIGMYPPYADTYRLRGLCYYAMHDHPRALADLRLYQRLSRGRPLDPQAQSILEELEQGAEGSSDL